MRRSWRGGSGNYQAVRSRCSVAAAASTGNDEDAHYKERRNCREARNVPPAFPHQHNAECESSHPPKVACPTKKQSRFGRNRHRNHNFFARRSKATGQRGGTVGKTARCPGGAARALNSDIGVCRARPCQKPYRERDAASCWHAHRRSRVGIENYANVVRGYRYPGSGKFDYMRASGSVVIHDKLHRPFPCGLWRKENIGWAEGAGRHGDRRR